MRITLISSFYPQKFTNQVGGAELNMRYLADYLEKENQRVKFICTRAHPIGRRHISKNGLNIYYPPTFKSKFISAILTQFFLIYHLLKSQSDINHQRVANIHTFTISIISFLKKTPFVFTPAHEDDCTLNFTDHRKNHPIYRSLVAFGIKNSSVIVIIAEYMGQLIKKRFPTKRIIIIKTGHPLETKSIDNLNKKNQIIYVSRIEHWKRPEIFVNLANEINNPIFQFTMIGGQTKLDSVNYHSRFEEKVRKSENLNWVGQLGYFETLDHIRESKYYIHTAISEGFPNTFIEAWLSKTLIVTFDWDPDGLFVNNRLGINVKGDIELLMKTIILLSKDEAQFQKITETAYNYALVNHSSEMNGKKHIKLYQKLTDS